MARILYEISLLAKEKERPYLAVASDLLGRECRKPHGSDVDFKGMPYFVRAARRALRRDL
jgi:hypothetical protein